MRKNKWKQKSLAMLLAFTMGLGILSVPGMSYAEVAVADTYIDKEIIKEQAEPSDITNETDLENQLEPNITTPSVIELEPLMALAVEQKSFALGKGTEEEPYQIANEADLRLLSKLVNKGDVAYTDKCYLLTDNIKLKSVEDWTPIGTESSPFKGCFDGGGKAIEDITAITSNLPPDLNYLGLFGNVLEGSIRNLTLEIKIHDSNIKPNLFVGGLAGSITGNDKSVISNVAVSGEIGVGENKAQKELRLGGLIGSGSKVKIENSNSEVAIETGRQYSETFDHKIGGFIGLNDQCLIEQSSSSGDIKVKVEGSVGGFVGVNKGEIIECSATVAVENISAKGAAAVGGFVGMNAAEINRCSAIGNVNVGNMSILVGGFFGSNKYSNAPVFGAGRHNNNMGEPGKIINCSSKGDVKVKEWSDTAGAFGGFSRGCVENCYATGDIATENNDNSHGEFLGRNQGGIKNCYATGAVSGKTKKGHKPCIYIIENIAPVAAVKNVYFNSNEADILCEYNTGVKVKDSYGVSESKMKSSTGEADELVTIMNNNIISENKRGIWWEWVIRPSENNGFPVLVESTDLGEGTSENPYIISNALDLIIFSKHINSENEKYNDNFYELKNDIDMSGFKCMPIGTKEKPFRGHFNGGNKSISNINMGTMTEPIKGLKYVGLFGYIDGGSITDLKVQATIYSDANYMGLLAGAIEGTDTRISNVELRGGLTSAFVAEDKRKIVIGALAGYVKDATVQNSNGNIHVKNNFYGGQDVNIGGFVGANEGGKINNCKIESIIESTKSPNSGGMKYIGGFVGLNQSFGEISNCSVSPRINGGDRGTIGGFAGGSYGEILNCSVKKIEGFDSYVQNDTVQNTEFCKIGGFIGENFGRILNCASNTNLKAASGSIVASFASDNNKTIVNCYAAGETQFNGNVGFVYINGSDANLKHIYYDKQYTKISVTQNRGESSQNYDIKVSEMKALSGVPNSMLDGLNGDFKTDESKAQWKKWVITAGENEGFPVLGDLPLVPLVLTVDKIERTSKSDATVSFMSSEEGRYYYNLESAVTDTSGEGKPCTKSNNTLKLENLKPGEQKIYIVAKDAAGNVSEKQLEITIPAYVVIDNKAPILTTGKVERTSKSDATVSFTSDEEGKYYYNLELAVTDTSGEGKPCTKSNNTLKLENLKPGEQKIYIVAKDAAGNVSEKQLEITIPAYVVIDNKAPILTTGKVERTSKSDATVSFTSDEEGKYYYNLELAVTDTSGEGKPCTTSNNTLKLENLKPGEQKIYIVAKDAAGNVSEKQLEITIPAYVVIDNKAPVLSNGKVERTSKSDATVSFTSDEEGKYYYNLELAVTDTSGEGKPCTKSNNTLKLENLKPGEQKIYIVAKDAAGNVSEKQLEITIPAYVVIDNKAPILTTGKVERTSKSDATVSFTSDEEGKYYYNLELAVTDTSGEGKPCTTSNNTLKLENLKPGEQKIYIVAKDEAGNVSEKQLEITIPAYVVIDNKAPILTTGKVERTSKSDATVSFTSDEEGKYYYNLELAVTDTSGEGKPCTTSNNTLKLENLKPGEQKIYIVAKDEAGNVSEKQLEITIPAYVVIDNKAPILTTGKVERTSKSDATVSFTSDEEGKYYYNLESAVTDTSGEGKPCTTSNNTLKLENLKPGEQKIYIVAKDAAGNVSEKQLEITIPAYVVIDNKAPILTTGKVERTSKSDATVSFTSDEEGKYYYNLELAVTDTSGEGKPCTTSNNTLKLENLKPGEQKIYIVAKDAAGNVSEKQLEITIPAYVAPVTPGGGSSSGGSGYVKPEQKTVAIWVNSKAENIAQETIKEENGKRIIELSITPEFVISNVSKDFKFRDDKNIVEIKVTDTDAETARLAMTGNIVKKLEDNDVTLSIQKDNIKYNIPAKEMTVESVAKKLNIDPSKLKEMQIEIEISKISSELAQKYQEIAKVGNNEFIIPPVEFNIIGRVTNEDASKQKVNINRFSSFVERTVELPQGNESKGAMTGIVFNSDGTYSPVPTKLITEKGRSYVKMNSLTNSTYSVIYNPITVDSVKLHWSESSVNDMASRMVLVDTKSFEPNKAISRAEFANYIVRALGLYHSDTKPGQSEFSDVKSDNPSLKGITIASQWGIISGYPDGSFRPQNTITREEAMSMYSRAMEIAQLDKSDDSRILNYKDRAKVSSWAYKAVQKTLGSGVFNGRTAQNIEPKGTFTCSEAAVAIRNLLIKAELING